MTDASSEPARTCKWCTAPGAVISRWGPLCDVCLDMLEDEVRHKNRK